MHPRPRPPRPRLLLACLLLACGANAAGQTTAGTSSVESLLQALRQSGVDVIYSSELVARELIAPTAAGNIPLFDRVRQALAANGLALRALGEDKYVVVRAEKPAPIVAPDQPIDEISVYASRYAINGGLAEPREMSPTDIERVPGSHDDALRALRSLPGIATNASARPYIRGSLSEDVLVRYDGIGLLDPFHLKNFQSLISAIDPAGIERIEVFSGGFPVQYGTRSGGVIDVTPPSVTAGHELRANLSLISAGVSSTGASERWPVEWLGAVRHSVLDMIDPVVDVVGKPEFSDSLGRVRWKTEQGAWTLGWLLLDDRLDLGAGDDAERARARYRDEYLWLAREHRFSDTLSMRMSVVTTSAERGREGTLQNPGVATGLLDESRSFNGLELANDWTWEQNGDSTYTFGGTVGATRADYRYQRHSEFSPEVATAFGRALIEDLDYAVRPEVATLAVYAANRRKWAHFEAELGLRVDGQHYENDGNHTQVSPRLNLRYDFSGPLRLYASAGRFTQAQHVEEWRVEEAQRVPDSAQVSIHSILGLEYDADDGSRLGLEAYTKRWTTTAPYFDNQLDPLALLPDLTPDRLRVAPKATEAIGLELSLRKPVSDAITTWGTLSWARVADDFRNSSDVLRSWDQPLSLNAGLAWKGSSASLSGLLGWHRGWPRTPVTAVPLELGSRNTARWGDYYSLDLRASWTWTFASGDFSTVLDLTNASDHGNECCLLLEMSDDSTVLRGSVEHWLPAIFNLGFTWRWRSP